MGHKAHPIGLRLGVHRKWKSNWFFNSKNYPKFILLNLNIEKFFKGFLFFHRAKSLLLNTQVIKLASNQLFIFVTYYRIRKRKLRFKSFKRRSRRWKFKNWQLGLEKYFQYKNISKHFWRFTKAQGNSLFLYELLLDTFNISLNHLHILKSKKSRIKNKNLILKFINIRKTINKLKTLKAFFLYKTLLNLVWQKLFKKIEFFKQEFFYLKFLKKISQLKLFKIFKKEYNFFSWFPILINFFFKFPNYLRKFKNIFNKIILIKIFYNKIFLKKKKKKYTHNLYTSQVKYKQFTEKDNIFSYKGPQKIKKFLSKITNLKINLIFINALSFAKFFYFIGKEDKKKKKTVRERFNVFQIQKYMTNRFKYDAIFIKDFVYLAFLSVLLKNPACIVSFIGEQFKRLPKNRKQFRLLAFINQTLKIFCQQRKEVFGIKLQITGRLNRRNRTHRWVFKKGNLAIQTYSTRVEYGYSEGLTRSGLIGIKLWFFYHKFFKQTFKQKMWEYIFYSQNTPKIKKKSKKLATKEFQSQKIKNKKFLKFKHAKTKSKKISKK